MDDTFVDMYSTFGRLERSKGGLQFTYISLDDYRIIMESVKGENKRTTNNRKAVPYSVFITPTLSNVGLTEKTSQSTRRQLQNYSSI